MAGYTDAELNFLADTLKGRFGLLSIHSADPGTTGANEVSGGTYARLAPSYGAAAAGTADLSASLTFNMPAGSSAAYWGAWSADGLTFRGSRPLSAVENFTDAGSYELTSAPATVQNVV